MKIRLNAFLARAGVASRREADRLVAEGRVCVNGLLVESPGIRVDAASDRVEVDGRKIRGLPPPRYILVNKPPGYLVTRSDPFRRPTVMDLLPAFRERLFPVGRLDLDSEGLLLLTNDGELANRLTHPRYEVKKVYRVRVKDRLDRRSLKRLEKGVFLDGRMTAPARVRVLGPDKEGHRLEVVIHEGRKREVRRMFEAVGHPVLALKRVAFGPLSLGGLRRGEWRELKPEETARLRRAVGAD